MAATPDCPCTNQCLPPNTVNSQTGQCEPPETYKLTLTPNSTTIEPGQSARLSATVIKQDGSAPSKNVTVNISLKVDAQSGGHVHGDSIRPRGGIDTIKCETDATCKTVTIPAGNSMASFDFKATDAAGTHTVTASCDKCVNRSASATVDVKVEGLQPIPASTYYKLIGATSSHSDNHYLTPEAASVLWRMAVRYQIESRFNLNGAPPPVLRVNDASLIWGGKFDISGTWSGSHAEHMRGTEVDVRANWNGAGTMPTTNFDKFETMILAEGVDANLECTKDKRGTPDALKHNRLRSNLCVSQLDGSQDDNRHFHIRLMGVTQ